MTIAGVLVGVVVVAVVAFDQLGGRASGRLTIPASSTRRRSMDGSNLGPADAPGDARGLGGLPVPRVRAVLARGRAVHRQPVRHRWPGPDRPPRHLVHRRVVGKDVDDPGNESTIPAMGAYCADQQELFWPFAHWIYANQAGENKGAFDREGVTRIAVAAGVERGGLLRVHGHARRRWPPSSTRPPNRPARGHLDAHPAHQRRRAAAGPDVGRGPRAPRSMPRSPRPRPRRESTP